MLSIASVLAVWALVRSFDIDLNVGGVGAIGLINAWRFWRNRETHNAKQGCLGPDSSFTGVDGTDIADPDKVWRCDSCRATGTSDVLAEWSGHNPNSQAPMRDNTC